MSDLGQEWPNTNRSLGSRHSTETNGQEVPGSGPFGRHDWAGSCDDGMSLRISPPPFHVMARRNGVCQNKSVSFIKPTCGIDF